MVTVEQTNVLEGEPRKTPDLVISGPGSPIVLETEFMPAITVEEDARGRLGTVLLWNRQRIEHVVACRFPARLRTMPQSSLEDALAKTIFSFRVLFLSATGHEDVWPELGFCEGSIDDLVDCLDAVGLSDSLLANMYRNLGNRRKTG